MENTEYVTLDPKTEHIKIHGLQRSGTNYLSHLINENFEQAKVLVNLGGWKHGHYMAPWAIGQEVHVLVIAKNPYSWLVSVYKYWGPNKKLRIGPDLDGVSFEDFVRNRCYIEQQRDIPFLYRCSNLVQHWNNMNFHWASVRLNSKRLCIVSYESLLENPEHCIQSIGESLGLKKKATFVDEHRTFVPAGETLRPSEERFDRDYYMKSQYAQFYTPDLLAFVNEELDLDLMVQFGYKYITADELERS